MGPNYPTDERLKWHLDTNQLYRERMCLAILAIDKRFSDVRPRHPRGGPDGGRDIEATYKQEQRAYGAVGFVNQANDSEEQKKQIKGKFGDDVKSALAADPKPVVFIFFTNINLTVGEKDELNLQARKNGFLHSDIFDRERMRIALDSADGFATRFQYLGVALSEAEQASFFARWGDNIQAEIAGIKSDTAAIKASTEENKVVLERLEKALSSQGEPLTFTAGEFQRQPDPSIEAISLAEQIPDSAGRYALALKATAESRFDEARSLFKMLESEEEANLQQFYKVLEQEEKSVARLYHADSMNELYSFHYSEAVEAAKKAVNLLPYNGTYQNQLGFCLLHAGRFVEAQTHLEIALQLREADENTPPNTLIINLASLASAYQAQGKLAEAEPLLIRALAMREEVSGPKHIGTAECLTSIGSLNNAQKRFEEAEQVFVRALDICDQYEETTGKKHRCTAICLNNLANTYNGQGNEAEAEKIILRVLAIDEAVSGPQHPNTAQSLYNLGALRANQGRYSESEAFLRRSCLIREKTLGSGHPDTILNRQMLAAVKQKQGESGEKATT